MVKGRMAVAVSSLASPYWMAHTMQTATSMARLVVACLQTVMQVALLLLAGQTRPCSSQVSSTSAPLHPCLTLPHPKPPHPAPPHLVTPRPTLLDPDLPHPAHMLLCHWLALPRQILALPCSTHLKSCPVFPCHSALLPWPQLNPAVPCPLPCPALPCPALPRPACCLPCPLDLPQLTPVVACSAPALQLLFPSTSEQQITYCIQNHGYFLPAVFGMSAHCT